jgi:hypothetical protein
MITADQAHKLKTENSTMNIIARQLEYVYSWIEGNAKLGKSKFNWIVPDEFKKDDVNYIVDTLRNRGFEIEKLGGPTKSYIIRW